MQSSLGERRAAFERDGFLLVRNLLGSPEIELFRRVIEKQLGNAERSHSLETHPKIKAALAADPRSRAEIVRLARRPEVLPLISATQQRPFIEHASTLVKMPRTGITYWHQDIVYWEPFDPHRSMVTLWIALSPCRRENGCMRFIPGSHRGPIHPFNKIDDVDFEIPPALVDTAAAQSSIVDCELDAGDAVFFHNSLMHAAYPNQVDDPRFAVKIVFQDRAKRKPGAALHPTSMEIPLMYETYGGSLADRKPFLRRVAEAIRVIGPPLTTPLDAINRFRARRREAGAATLTESGKNIRRFQLEGTDREWRQLFFYGELLDRLDGIPGDVAEFGVAGGISLISIVRILRMLEKTDPKHKRMVYGFDSFEGLPELGEIDTVARQGNPSMVKGGFFDPSGYRELFAFADREANVRLIRGWFSETLPAFLAQNPATGFALVHIDCDLYESTKVALDLVWDRVVPGGIVAFDELLHRDYPGETVAFREFAEGKAITLRQSRYWPLKYYIQKFAGA